MPTVFYHAGRFPPEEELRWPTLIPLLSPAAAALARYDALLELVPNPRLLLAPLMTREAVLSSRIEGTQATMGDVLQFEAGQAPASPRRRDDITEVLNYRTAMGQAERLLMEGKLPLCQRVLKPELWIKGLQGRASCLG